MIAEEDRFPVGMRVLAVDDDPICLKVLDSLLRKCNYHVTTTNQAVDALRLLRENRDDYDLVISDVNMPDMDGFKLLELVGLEMDLPVIMLSAHSDKDLVYKGVTHGAVDYLLKPVRLEELKNIWQHIVRRKKLHSNRSSNLDKPREDSIQGPTSTNDQTGKSNRKRKDQNEEEEEGNDEDLNENEESGSQKKARVVWMGDLHRKFVAAVNQLGLDKAVPKKILDLMNVEGLTRENVASHLQKYRQYLKRLSSEVSQQQDSSYLRMASLDGFVDFHSMSSSGRLANTSVPSYPQGTMLGRLNSPSGLTLRGIASSGLLHPQKASNSFNSLAKIQPTVSPQSHSLNVFQAKSVSHIGQLNYSAATYGPMMLQQNQRTGAFGIQSSLSVPSVNHNAVQLPEFQTNLVPLRQNVLTGSSHMGNISNDLVSSSVVSVPLEDFQGQIGLIDNSIYNSQKHRIESANNVDACIFQNSEVESSLSEQTKTQDDNYDSLDDLMNAMIKRQDQNGTILMDGEFEFDGYSLGSCF